MDVQSKLPSSETSISAEQRKFVKAQINALAPFKEVRETMPLQYVQTFLLVASEENLNVSEYAKRAGIGQSLMTRHLSDLGEINRYHEEGMGLLESYRDMMDRRNVLVRLSAKGKGVLQRMCWALE